MNATFLLGFARCFSNHRCRPLGCCLLGFCLLGCCLLGCCLLGCCSWPFEILAGSLLMWKQSTVWNFGCMLIVWAIECGYSKPCSTCSHMGYLSSAICVQSDQSHVTSTFKLGKCRACGTLFNCLLTWCNGHNFIQHVFFRFSTFTIQWWISKDVLVKFWNWLCSLRPFHWKNSFGRGRGTLIAWRRFGRRWSKGRRAGTCGESNFSRHICSIQSLDDPIYCRVQLLPWCHGFPFHINVFTGSHQPLSKQFAFSTLQPRKTLICTLLQKSACLSETLQEAKLLQKTFKGLSDFTRVSHQEGWPGWATHRKMISHQPAHKRNFLHLCHGSGNRSRVLEHTKARASGETCEVDLQFQWIPKTFPFSGYLPSTQVKKVYLQFLHLEATPSKAFLPELTACLWLWLLFLLSWCLVVVVASSVVACMFLLIWFSYCSLLLKFWLSYCYGIVLGFIHAAFATNIMFSFPIDIMPSILPYFSGTFSFILCNTCHPSFHAFLGSIEKKVTLF